jgi:hypothetical protein
MISANIRIDRKVLDDIQEAIENAPASLSPVFTKKSLQVRNQIRDEMRKVPARPSYPIQWASVKQRKAFFASNGFDRGIPTVRTGEYAKAWNVVFQGFGRNDGGVIQLENDRPEARYIGGGDAQPFHIDRWPQAVDVVVKYEEALYTTLVDSWFAVLDIR